MVSDGRPGRPARHNPPGAPQPAPERARAAIVRRRRKIRSHQRNRKKIHAPTLKSPKETIDDAADALSRLTKSPGVKGRAACPVAANGAPDCKVAADKLCQSKGFKQGKSLDVDTTRNCSAKALLSGRKPEESECRTETYVTRAVCQ